MARGRVSARFRAAFVAAGRHARPAVVTGWREDGDSGLDPSFLEDFLRRIYASQRAPSSGERHHGTRPRLPHLRNSLCWRGDLQGRHSLFRPWLMKLARIVPRSHREEDGMSQPAAPGKKRLLDEVRDALRVRHMSPRTERTYVHWIRRYILFHDKRHPSEMAEPEINVFLTHLATARRVSPATQTQALCAVLFLYRAVLGREIGEIELVRARRRRKIPVVLTREEVRSVLERLDGTEKLFCTLLYGTGL